MQFTPFAVEEYLSTHEHAVEFNYSESGVHPMRLKELLELAGDDGGEELLETSLNYPQVNGEPALRERIAALYEGATPDNVLVTVGASEANLLAATTLLEPGDEIAVLRPTYPQFGGIARNIGVEIRHIELVEEEDRWRLDLDSLKAAIGRRTKVVAIVNPNNPTGSILNPAEIDALVKAARETEAWLLVDEVYAGSERVGETETPSLFGGYARTLALGSLSKAYGLPGLRCGWVVAPEDLIQRLWRRHEYAVISASALSNRLAAAALAPRVRGRIIARTRGLIRAGYDMVSDYLQQQDGAISMVPPQASAVSFMRLNHPTGATAFAERLHLEKSVLVVPGEFFGRDEHFRFSFALPAPYLRAGLDRMSELLAE